jgi:cytosine/adenosine deaminase-related metal-dependent hydrolase
MRESVALARRHGICSHTHLAESPDDDAYMHHLYGKSSVHMAEEWGWVGDDVWYAHATVLSDDEIEILARTGTAVALCPNSIMYTAAGCCRVPHLLQKGVTVGLGVDGSAANNSSNLLDEARNALLLQRMFFGAGAMSPTQALELATLGSAKLLRRDDIGALAPDMAADIIAVNLDRLAFAGGLHDPIAALVLCASGQVDWSIVNGRVRVEKGQLVGVDVPALVKRQNQLAADLVRRAEKRSGRDLSTPTWRRAYPYDPMRAAHVG